MKHSLLALTLLVAPALAQPQVRPGYFASRFVSSGLGAIACLSWDAAGRLWVGMLSGNIVWITDANGDGVGELHSFANPGPTVLGIALVGGDMYVSHELNGRGVVSCYFDTNRDGFPDAVRTTVLDSTGRWEIGAHQNNQLNRGPDGWLYMGIGTLLPGGGPANGTLTRFHPSNPNGTFEIYAIGLRNSYDHCWDAAGNLFATDNEREDFGPDFPPDEVNHVVQGGDYGFPHSPPGSDGIQPIAETTPHSSTDCIVWYDHPRFPGLRNTLIVSQFRPNSGLPLTTGRRLATVQLTPFGTTFRTVLDESFVRFATNQPPLDLVVHPKGYLLVGEFPGSSIWRISYPYLDLPATASVGGSLDGEVSGRGGDAYVLMLAAGTASLTVPGVLGTLELDPTTLTFLTVGTMPPADETPVSLPIPNVASLRGAQLQLQVIASIGATTPVFTNRRTVLLQ